MELTRRDIRRHLHAVLAMVCSLLCTAAPLSSYSQAAGRQPGISQKEIPEEVLYIVTDRDIYISGEDVYLKAYCLSRQTHQPSGLSRVAYVSLLDRTSNPVVRIKIWLNGQSGSGKFTIPDTLRTGNYIISACTHLMQNFSPDLFAARKISVINPFLKIDHIEIGPQKSIPAADARDTVTEPGVHHEDYEAAAGMAVCRIQTDKATYQPREKVRVSVNSSSNDGKPVVSEFVLSVTRSFAYDKTNRNITAGSFSPHGPGDDDPGKTLTGNNIYLPEPEGHLVTGTVYNTVTGEPVTNETMVLSVVGKTALCRFCKTDENGAFYFIVNESGKQEIVIQPLNPELKELYVELNDPFPEEYSKTDPGQFFIDTTMLKEINKAVVGTQVQALYKPLADTVTNSRKEESVRDFYGDSRYEVSVADYIELSSLSEVFKELLPVVFTDVKKGRNRLALDNNSPEEKFLTDPFVLVDGVPVSDHDALLKISPSGVEKIKILNSRYYVSDICLTGIIDLRTVKGNFRLEGIDLPALRQEFEAPLSGSEFRSPVYLTDIQKQSRIPDLRNTLYWNPDLGTNPDGTAVAEFFTSDEPGDYVIIAEGLTSDGQQIRSVAGFSVTHR